MFTPRLTRPEAGNKYYITKAKGGWSTAIVGKPTDQYCNVLSNCVGYVFGRYNEIMGDTTMSHLSPVNAENFFSVAKSQGLPTGSEPKLGAVIVWQKGNTLDAFDGAGHVAVVEAINSDGSITTSESGYNCSNPFWTQIRYKGNGNWGQNNDYKFLGFIYQPETTSQPTPSQKEETVRDLQIGMYGEDVKQLQTFLSQKGYLRKNETDGDFGKITLGAVLAFQLDNGLTPDGIVGPATRKKING